MKLVLATPLYPPENGGPATYAKILVENLGAYGIDVTLVKFSDVRTYPKLIRHHMYFRKLVKALREADALLALDPVSVGLPSMWAARKCKKPYVVKVVGDYAWEQGRQRFNVTQDLDTFLEIEKVPGAVAMLRRIQSSVAKHAKKIIVPSDYLKEIVMKWGVSESKIERIYNSVEIPDDIPPQSKEEGTFLIVSTGRRVPWKGFEAIERVAQKHTTWRVKIVSGVTHEEALSWVQAADVFVLNSTYEGFPHALLEAMALGTPVIAASNKGNAALVEDRVTGRLVAPSNDEALEQALIEVAEHTEEAQARASAAKKIADTYSIQNMCEHTAQFLKSNL